MSTCTEKGAAAGRESRPLATVRDSIDYIALGNTPIIRVGNFLAQVIISHNDNPREHDTACSPSRNRVSSFLLFFSSHVGHSSEDDRLSVSKARWKSEEGGGGGPERVIAAGEPPLSDPGHPTQ